MRRLASARGPILLVLLAATAGLYAAERMTPGLDESGPAQHGRVRCIRAA